MGLALASGVLEQALSYARVALVRWAMVTNGVEVVVLDADHKQGGQIVPVIRFELGRAREFPQYLMALSPDGLSKQLLAEMADEVTARSEAIGIFQRERPKIEATIERALQPVPNLTDRAREAVRDFMARLQGIVEGSTDVTQSEKGQPGLPTPGATSPPRKTLVRLSKSALPGPDTARVVICPTNPDGIDFVERFNAWAQVVTLGEPPNYCALYVTKPDQSIRYIAKVRRVVPVLDWLAETKADPAVFTDGPSPHKFAIEFEGPAVELADPIRLGPGDPHVQGRMYTTLGQLRKATRLGDLRQPRNG